jgi:hypothetical protein
LKNTPAQSAGPTKWSTRNTPQPHAGHKACDSAACCRLTLAAQLSPGFADAINLPVVIPAAFIPALGAVRVEMPGGSHFVWTIDGALPGEVVFDPKAVDRVLKVLISQAALSDKVTLAVLPDFIALDCGSAKISIPRQSEKKRRPK